MRAHLFKFLYRFIDAPSNADLRQVLATGNLEEMFAVVDEIERRLTNAVRNTSTTTNNNTMYVCNVFFVSFKCVNFVGFA